MDPRADPRPFPASMAWLLDNPLSRALADRLVRRLPVSSGMRVVDVGCGPGRLSIPIAHVVGNQGEVLAVDIQPEMLTIVERRAGRQGLKNVRSLQAAAGAGALPLGRYDLALLAAVLGEIPAERRAEAVREIALALRPGGVLVVVEGVFDPHRQTRETILRLAEPAGLVLDRDDPGRLAAVLQLRLGGA